jgi:hypothetical protein
LFFAGFISRLRNPARFSAVCVGGHRCPICCAGQGIRRPMEFEEIVMAATRVGRPAALFAAGSLAAAIATFAIGQAGAQFVNPVPPPPPPTFNPSSPNTVPQAPERPVSPTSPGGLPGSAPVPSSPVITPVPDVTPQTVTAPAAAHPGRSRTHARHHGRIRERGSRRHARFHAVPVTGPSYYPGLGEFYPPYPNPCHFRQVWDGFYGGYRTYTCSW